MKRLAMAVGRNQRVNRFGMAYFGRPQIRSIAAAHPTDFHVGIYSPPPELSIRRYDRDTIDLLPLSGPLILDIDAHDPTQAESARTAVHTALDRLDGLGVEPILFNSGRGFHLEIPSALRHADLPALHGVAARQLAPTADTGLYTASHVIRHPNTVNPTTGTYKGAISRAELDLPDDQLRDLLREPRAVPDITPSQAFDEYLIDIFETHLHELRSLARQREHITHSGPTVSVPPGLPYAVSQILRSAIIAMGTRNKVTIRLALELRKLDLPSEETLSILLSWGTRLHENGCSKATLSGILINTADVVSSVYAADEIRLDDDDFIAKIQRRYPRLADGRRRGNTWKRTPNAFKVYCAFRAAAEIANPMFLARSVIKRVTGLAQLSNRTTAYIPWLIDNGYIEEAFPESVGGFVPHAALPDTKCYRLLK